MRRLIKALIVCLTACICAFAFSGCHEDKPKAITRVAPSKDKSTNKIVID